MAQMADEVIRLEQLYAEATQENRLLKMKAAGGIGNGPAKAGKAPRTLANSKGKSQALLDKEEADLVMPLRNQPKGSASA